ncbi:MAG: hypothetical protein BGO49_25815 [Planctomycetales bacterium 71-10]|nr:MAG: hypothetical protein BGO49_25815 [Planctomycetales bacterium 71-10]
MTIRTRTSWAATALAAALLGGCGGSPNDLTPGMPDNIDMSKVTSSMPNNPMKSIGKPSKQSKARKAD